MSDKPNSAEKANQAKQQKAQEAAYAQKMAQSQLNALLGKITQAKSAPAGKELPGGKPASIKPETAQSHIDQDTVFHPGGEPQSPAPGAKHPAGEKAGPSIKNKKSNEGKELFRTDGGKTADKGPAEKKKRGGEKGGKRADGPRQNFLNQNDVYRPGISDQPQQSLLSDMPKSATPDSKYDHLPAGERRFWKKIDDIARESRDWHAQNDPKPDPDPTRLRGAHEGLDGLPDKVRADLEAGNYPHDKPFEIGNRLYLPDPLSRNVKWIAKEDIPPGACRVVNGRLNVAGADGDAGTGSDYWVRKTKSGIETLPHYPEDKPTVEAFIRKSQNKGLIDSFGNANEPDPDLVQSVMKANRQLNDSILESLGKGNSLETAAKDAWKNAMADLRLSSLQILTTVMGMATNGIQVSFHGGGAGAGAGDGPAGLKWTKSSGRAVPPEGPMAAPKGKPAAGPAEAPPAGRPRITYVDGKLQQASGEPPVSFVRSKDSGKGVLGKPEGSAKPGDQAHQNQRADTAREKSVEDYFGGKKTSTKAGPEGPETEEPFPTAYRTERNTYQNKDARQVLMEAEEVEPGVAKKARVRESYQLGLEGRQTAVNDKVQVLHWEPATKWQGDYGIGIDDIGKWNGNDVILEWKGQGGKLSGDQMSDAWVGRKIAQLDALNEPMAKTLLSSAKSGTLKGMVYQTKESMDAGLSSGRLSRSELRGPKGSRLTKSQVSEDGVISYSSDKVMRAYREQKALLDRAIRTGDKAALKVLMR